MGLDDDVELGAVGWFDEPLIWVMFCFMAQTPYIRQLRIDDEQKPNTMDTT